MTRLRLFAALVVLIAAFAVPASVFAHPSSVGDGYCKFPDGTLTPGHCSAADHANGGHDTHIPSTPNGNPPGGGNTPNGNPPNGNPPGGNPPSGNPPGGNPPGDGNPPSGNPPGGGGGGGGGGSDTTPVYTGIGCHITHAARPAQICSVEGGMQYWFIGADGSAQPGPFLPDSPRIERYEGTNPMTGKSVVIDYVVEGEQTLLRVSTFYPDNEYDTNKPYIFTLDPGHTVSYISW